MALEKNVQAMERKATSFFGMELYHNNPDPKPTVKIWRENLRQMHSQDDMHKAVPLPPLFPVKAFAGEELIWEAQKLRQCFRNGYKYLKGSYDELLRSIYSNFVL